MPDDELRVRRLTLTDDEGRDRLTLGVDADGPFVQLLAEDGRPGIVVELHADGPMIALLGPDGIATAKLVADDRAVSLVLAPGGHPRVQLGATADGGRLAMAGHDLPTDTPVAPFLALGDARGGMLAVKGNDNDWTVVGRRVGDADDTPTSENA